MRERTVEMAGAMAKAGVGLLALSLMELPAIASAQLRSVAAGRLLLQLAAVDQGDQVEALLTWAEGLPGSTAYGRELDDCIRVAVVGVIDGVQVEVWTHLKGEHLIDTGCFLGLPLAGESHALSLGALRALVEHRAVSHA